MKPWYSVLSAGAVLLPAALHASQYLTFEVARSAAFPGASAFADRTLAFTPQQLAAITKRAGVAPATAKMRVSEARSGNQRLGWAIVDRVIGKHELITFMVALDAGGTVTRVEILDYRENYGGEVANSRWLKQFVGKRVGAPVKVDRDIRNISGATLSSRHVADGVRQVLALHELVLAHG